jgi:hypothetical protein
MDCLLLDEVRVEREGGLICSMWQLVLHGTERSLETEELDLCVTVPSLASWFSPTSLEVPENLLLSQRLF